MLTSFRARRDPKCVLAPQGSAARAWATRHRVDPSGRFFASVACCSAFDWVVTAFHSDASIGGEFIAHSLCTAHCVE